MDNLVKQKQCEKIFKLIKWIVGIAVLIVVGMYLLYPFLGSYALSIKEYQPFVGYVESKAMGTEHFEAFREHEQFGNIVKNSMYPNLFAMGFGMIYLFFAIWAIGSFKNIFAKGAMAFLFALPAFIPSIIYVEAHNELLYQFITPEMYEYIKEMPTLLYYAIPGFISGIRLSALFAIIGLFVKEKPLGAALKVMALFVAVKLATLFTVDFDFSWLTQEPSSLEWTENFDTYIYKQGLAGANFSYASAVGVYRTLLQLFPTAIGAVIAILMFRDKTDIKAKTRAYPATVFVLIGLFVVAIAAYSVLDIAKEFRKAVADGLVNVFYDYNMFEDTAFEDAFSNAWSIAFGGAGLIAGFALVFAYGINNSKGIGIAFALLVLACSENLISRFIIMHEAKLLDDVDSVRFMFANIVPLVALLTFAMIKFRKNILSTLSIFITVGSAMFAWIYGAFREPLISLNNVEDYPISIAFRQVDLAGVWEDVFERIGSDSIYLSDGMWPKFLLIPIIVAFAGIAVACLVDWKLDDLRELIKKLFTKIRESTEKLFTQKSGQAVPQGANHTEQNSTQD